MKPAALNYSYQAPTTGFNIPVPSWANVLALNPAGALASGTIVTPPAPIDGQQLTLVSTQIVSALTLSAGGAQTVLGSAAFLLPNVPRSWLFDAPTQTWIPTAVGTSLSGTFANRPTGIAGLQYFATDLGTNGLLLVYNNIWKPVSGRAVIAWDPAAHVGAGTGAEANYANVPIPANLVSPTGCLIFTATGKFTGTTGTKTMIVRHTAASGSVTGGTTIKNNTYGGSSTALSGIIEGIVECTSAGNQITTPTGIAGLGSGQSSTALTAGAVDMTAASYLNFNVNGNAADTVGYQGILVEWIEG